MSVIIEEIHAQVENDQAQRGGGEGAPRPTVDQQKQSVLDLLDLMQERRERLAVD